VEGHFSHVGVGLAATAVVLRIAHENMFAFEQLERELSALKEARPQADLKLIERNNRVYLEIHNPGASAKFRTVLTLKGVNQNPTKNLFAKWDHLMNGGAVAEIAKGTTERLRLADRVSDDATMRYTVFWGSDGAQSQSLQSAKKSTVADPGTHDWRVEMALTIVGIPDFVDGPIFRTVVLSGNGTAFLV
jgi:hypothetical protein